MKENATKPDPRCARLTAGIFLSSSGVISSFFPSSGFVSLGSSSLWVGMRAALQDKCAAFAAGSLASSSGLCATFSAAIACVTPRSLAASTNQLAGIPMRWDSPLLCVSKNCSVQKSWSQSLVAASASPPKSNHKVRWVSSVSSHHFMRPVKWSYGLRSIPKSFFTGHMSWNCFSS